MQRIEKTKQLYDRLDRYIENVTLVRERSSERTY